MTRIFLAASAAALLAGGAAAAPTETNTVTINGTTPPTCNMQAPTVVPGSANNAVLNAASASSGVIVLSGLADTTNATFTGGGAAISLDFNAVCNYAHAIGLKTINGRLTNPSAGPFIGTFNSAINYLASFAWNSPASVSVILFANGTAGATAATAGGAVGPRNGTARLQLSNLSVPAPSAPLVSGLYSDVLVVQLGAPI